MSSSKRIKFLTAIDIDETVDTIAASVEGTSIRVALAGGAALQVYGSERFTKDVDFVASNVDEVVTACDIKVKSDLSIGGIGGTMASGVPVDIIVRDDTYRELYENALATAVKIEDVSLPVISQEYMVAIKFAAGRTKDLADLEFLLLDSDLDYDAARAVVVKELGLYAGEELDSFRDETVWLRSRGKQ